MELSVGRLQFCLALGLILTGCASREPTLIARQVALADIQLDGRLDEPAWRGAQKIWLKRPVNLGGGSEPIESASVCAVWTAEHLIFGFEAVDRDLVAESDEDQAYHYKFGDVWEVFVKSDTNPWYWELYATPNGKKTRFFYPGAGYRGLPSTFNGPGELKTAAHAAGTLNAWHDDDSGWTAEMLIPRSDLCVFGDKLETDAVWRVLFGRYNYGRDLPRVELTTWPRVQKIDFHAIPSFGTLKLLP